MSARSASVLLLLLSMLGGCAASPDAAPKAIAFDPVALRLGAVRAIAALERLDAESQVANDADAPARSAELRALVAAIDAGTADAWLAARPSRTVRPDRTPNLTAYAALEVRGRRTPDDRFRVPLHAPPDGRAPDDATPWATRAQIADDDLLADRALVFLDDEFDAYLAQVNGSVRVRLDDGSALHLAHRGTNARPYASLGRLLADAGAIPADGITLDAIRAAWAREPALVRACMRRNERYVFFEVVPADAWPRASSGVALVPGVSAAADPAVHPLGSILVVEIDDPPPGEPARRVVIVHDTGGAIRGPARLDLYLGAGDTALREAGRFVRTGRVQVIGPRKSIPGVGHRELTRERQFRVSGTGN